MKRVMLSLVMLVAVTSLPWGALFVEDASAVESTVQIVCTTPTGDYVLNLDDPGELEVFGDPDDAITGNRGHQLPDGLLEILAGLVDEDGGLDLFAVQLVLDTLNGL